VAKTFEALTKSNTLFEEVNESPFYLSDWRCPDLSRTREIGNLSQKLFLEGSKDQFKVYNFTSSRKGEGTSTVVFNLIKHLIAKGSPERILFIDANMSHPVLHTAFDKEPSPGLYEAIHRKADLENTVYRLESSNFDLMPVGFFSKPNQPNLDQKFIGDLISELRNKYQYIIIDSSPLLASSDSLPFAVNADTSFLIVQANSTQWEVVEKAKDYLHEHKCHLSGVVLNRVLKPIPKWLYNRL